ncbi:MAG TPA: YfhO family protein [Chloroflexota bacterium]|nr:YfhO family protein [Chloroflexota bacterium]
MIVAEARTGAGAPPSLTSDAPWLPRLGRALRSVLSPDLAAVAAMVAVTLAFFWPSIADGLVVHENDTRIFYFPLFVRLSEALKAGQLPLWSPHIFGGYPIFADGEAGSLYPLHLLGLLLLPFEAAFAWLRPIRFLQAALFTFLFCRAIGVGRFGAVVGALTFAFGGFAVAQMHHTNISTAAVWLPLILAFGELALRTSGRTRYAFALFAGVAFGMQGLVIHVQVVLMSVLTFAAYCGYRCTVGPIGIGPGPYSRFGARFVPPRLRLVLGRPLLAVGLVALAGACGAGLAAAQLLPLFELGTFSFRGGGVDYAFASQYSLPPVQLVSLLFPEFFMAGDGYWGLWSHWEVFVYFGVAPLLLALVGLVAGRRRLVLFFGAVGLASLVMATGEYSPFGIHRAFSGLPGFSVLRAPGRFSYLASLSAAMLASFGADALTRRRRPSLTALVPVQALAIAVPIAVSGAAAFVAANKPAAMAWLQATFMRMRGFDPRWSQEQLYTALASSLDVLSVPTLRQLVLLGASAALFLAWDRLPSLARAWQTLLVAVVAADLIAAGQRFHPAVPYDDFAALPGMAQYVQEHPGLFRVFTQKGSAEEPNRLLAYGIADANGYSSLEPDRHSHLAFMAEYAQNPLLDLMNVRYYAVRNAYVPQASFTYTSFNPRKPLISSTGKNPAARVSYVLDDAPATVLRMIATMRWATAVPQDEEVARIVTTDSAGQRRTHVVRAGVHVADWAWERPDIQAKIAHAKPPAAFRWEQRDGRSQPYWGHLYFAEFPFDRLVRIRRVDVLITHPTAAVEFYGLSLFDDESKEVTNLDIDSSARFRRVYVDNEMALYENQTWLPRAWLVPGAVIEKPSSEIVTRMAQGDFAPERLVILEEQFDLAKLPPPLPAEAAVAPISFNAPRADEISSAAGHVRILRADPEHLRLEITASQNAMLFMNDLFYPGWTALVDGQESQIYRANYLYRAVYVPAGPHAVDVVYRPRAFRFGLLLTLLACTGVIGGLFALTRRRAT